MKKYDIFICYSRHDAEIAISIRERLIKENIAFYDGFTLIADDYAAAITKRISNSRFILYLHSEHSIQSNWVRKELEFAINKGLKVIPVNISGFRSDNSSIRKLLYDKYWLEYDQYAYDYREQFEKLIHIILRIVNPAKGSDVGVSQRPEYIEPTPSHAESYKEDNVVKYSRPKKKHIWSVFLLIIFTILAIFSFVNNNYYDTAILVATFIAITGLLVYLFTSRFHANTQYSVRIHNSDTRRKVIIRVDGKEDCRIAPLGMSKIERRKGEHVISAQMEAESYNTFIVNHCFNKETDGKIIQISFTQKQKRTEKVDMLKYRCFIAGSTSITNERNAARAVLSILYNQYEKYDFYITAHTYEDFKNKHKIDGHQYDYDTFIREKADCAIFIICNHVGDKTLKEYDLATKTFEDTNGKRPAIFVYNDVSCINDTFKQDPSVIKFRKLVESKHAYWRDYTEMDILMLKIKDDISAELTDVLEMKPSIERVK